jgi:hypothetical protein
MKMFGGGTGGKREGGRGREQKHTIDEEEGVLEVKGER